MTKKILIYNSGGGLGDSIQLFPLILSIKNHFRSVELYYLGAHKNHFLDKLKNYNINIINLDLKIKYFGFRWRHFFEVKKNFTHLNLYKFDLILDLQSKLRNTIILKRIPSKSFYSSTFNFAFCSVKKNYLHNSNISIKVISNLEKILNTKIKLIDFDLSNLNNLFIEEAKKLLPDKNYIGLSMTQGNKYRKKSWSINNFIKLAHEIKKIIKNLFFL